MSEETAMGAITNVEVLYERFCGVWRREAIGLKWEDTSEWTNRILKSFRILGGESGYDVYPDSDRRDSYYHSEYMLLDLCWTRRKDESPYWMQLALESEWADSKEALEDFYKLAELKCPWKVLICSEDKRKRQDFVERLSSWVKRLRDKLPHELYLIIIFPVDPPSWSEDTYPIQGYIIDSDGNPRVLDPKHIPKQ